jgi:hypothetical protein
VLAVFEALRANAAAVELGRAALLCLHPTVQKLAVASEKEDICAHVKNALKLLNEPINIANQLPQQGIHAPARLEAKATQSRQQVLHALREVLAEMPEIVADQQR